MPGKLALSSGDFAAAFQRQEDIHHGTISRYELVCIFKPPAEWMVKYVADFTFWPAGLEANVRMPLKTRLKPFVLSLRSDSTNKCTCYIFGRFEYGKSSKFCPEH